MTPFDDFKYLINSVLLGEEPTVEDLILLVGTFVAFVAFILWCCFPVVPKEGSGGGGGKPPRQYDPRVGPHAGWWGGRRGRHYEPLAAS